jgi:regulator of protease activity HflC (stomatin/prohibitin superfamily)
MDIDSVLTGGRAGLSFAVMRNAQEILDDLETGVTIAAVELIGIVPPMETAAYFEDVRSAAIYKETRIQQAQESSASLFLNAQAQAGAYTQSAISNQHERLTKVHNEMAEFTGIYEQYEINPRLIVAGNLMERAGSIISQAGASIIIPDGSEPPLIILP